MTSNTMKSVNKQSEAELVSLVFDGKFEAVHAPIRDALGDALFDQQPGLTMGQSGRLAYERCRFLRTRVPSPTFAVENPDHLYALAEWPSLLDVSSFSLLMVHYNLCFGTLYDHGKGRADLQEYFDDLDSMRSFGPYMATELGYGNNVAMLRTEAHYDHDDRTFTLRTPDRLASKHMSYSGFRDVPKIAVVLAKLVIKGKNEGIFPFIVRLTDENGLAEGVKALLCPEKPVQGLDNGLTAFDGVKIPVENMLRGSIGEISADGEFVAKIKNPRQRFLATMSRIVPGRLCVASAGIGAGKASVYLALKFSQNRRTNAPGSNDVPVLDYMNHQQDLFGSLAKVYASVLLLNYAKAQYAAHGDIADVNNLISITKATTTWDMTDVINVCRERCGAQGIFSVNRIADFVSLLQGLVTAEGDNQVLLGNAAGQIFAKQVDAPVSMRASRGVSRVEDLVELLHLRESGLCDEARAAAADPDKASYFEALNLALPSGVEMTRVRSARLALEQMKKAAEGAQNDDVRDALHALSMIFGIEKLKKHVAWLLAKGHVSAEAVLAMDEVQRSQFSTVRQHLDLVLAGFQLSPELLRAPIAQEDYASAFYAAAQTTDAANI